MKLENEMIEGLEDLLRKLENNEEIEVREVSRIQTADGPMHIEEIKNMNIDELRSKDES